MGSSTERRSGDLDTSQPGIRQIHAWIREQTAIRVELLTGASVCGRLRWVDQQFLAVEPEPGQALILVSREAIALMRPAT